MITPPGASDIGPAPYTTTDRYEIRLAGTLDEQWSDWFEGFALRNNSDGSCTLIGPVADQAALQGVLRRIGDLGISLVSLRTLSAKPPGHPLGQKWHPAS